MKSKSDDRQHASAIIVSPDRLQANLLKSCLCNDLPITIECHTNLSLSSAMEEPLGHRLVYLLDCLRIDVDTIGSMLQTNQPRVPSHVLIVLYNVRDQNMLAPLVLRYKVRGIFFSEDSQKAFIKGMKTILSGRLWLTRKMLSDCVRMTDRPLNKPASPCLDILSQREKEILRHVVLGESNQEIADAMQISLHTVKTHLYNTYKKIDVPNRFQAALWGATYLSNREDT